MTPIKRGDKVFKYFNREQRRRTGVVINDRNGELVTVIWDGTKTPATYHVSVLQLASDDAGQGVGNG